MLAEFAMDQDLDERAAKRIKLELADRSLNFSTSPEDLELASLKKPKTIRDPMSHRIIEKRRRDRMNNCLADLSRLIPTNYLKQGQGRIEKTEIIEMAIKHINTLSANQKDFGPELPGQKTCCRERLYLGYKECQDEVMRFFVEVEGWDADNQLCRKLMVHLDQSANKFLPQRDSGNESEGSLQQEPFIHTDRSENTSHPPSEYSSSINNEGASIYPSDDTSCGMQMPFERMGDSQGRRCSAPSVIGLHQESMDQSMTDQQRMQEQMQQDGHLRTLLTPITPIGSRASSIADSPWMSSVNMVEDGSGTSGNKSEGDSSGIVMSEQSSCSGKETVYKFKHNITQRFSLEEKQTIPQSDTSSSSSREENQEKKRKFHRHKVRCPSSTDSSPYPNSDSSNSKVDNEKDFLSRGNDHSNSNRHPLPAFVLHPQGTHYLPLSIHSSNLQNIKGFSLDSASSGPKVFHPISIPVNFGGPLLCMRKISIRSGETTGTMETNPDSLSSDFPQNQKSERTNRL